MFPERHSFLMVRCLCRSSLGYNLCGELENAIQCAARYSPPEHKVGRKRGTGQKEHVADYIGQSSRQIHDHGQNRKVWFPRTLRAQPAHHRRAPRGDADVRMDNIKRLFSKLRSAVTTGHHRPFLAHVG